MATLSKAANTLNSKIRVAAASAAGDDRPSPRFRRNFNAHWRRCCAAADRVQPVFRTGCGCVSLEPQVYFTVQSLVRTNWPWDRWTVFQFWPEIQSDIAMAANGCRAQAAFGLRAWFEVMRPQLRATTCRPSHVRDWPRLAVQDERSAAA